jgi:lipopolysaccharide transport system ATP-binding protein
MSDTVIHVENLGKKYIIGHQKQERYTSLRDVITDKVKSFSQVLSRKDQQEDPTHEEFWALKDVSFEIKQGDRVGIIGRNGAGKSTLLKILSRITEPTEGRISINGRVASLLEVGTGFHPELTGRENIFLNGAILGMDRVEIKRKFDEIVAFAEVEKFLDTPVKRYSSGMYVRLAFAVAAHLEPEILIVDEVLAVGDAQFQKKCLGKMEDVGKEGRTVLFVSHNMGAVSRLCQRGLWLEQGRLKLSTDIQDIVSEYLTSNLEASGEKIWQDGIANVGIKYFLFKAVRIYNSQGGITSHLSSVEDFWVEIEYELSKNLANCRVGLIISTVEGTILFATYDTDICEDSGYRQEGSYVSKCQIPGNILNSGRFLISINAGIPGLKNLAKIENILSLEIEDMKGLNAGLGKKRIGIINPLVDWKVSSS